jgi:coenzyme F420-dependent glucose-6-phosphate dehydrogenase
LENAVIGYWAAHEQYPPYELTQFVIDAEKGGFETVVTSDHFLPWFNTGAQGSFAWTWIASTAAYTKKITIGTGVTSPDRYHPAIIAQAFATLDSMFPGRITLGMGTGEAMNSIPLGIPRLSSGQSVLRLKNSLEIITKLWDGNFEDYNGFFYRLKHAKLYTLPRRKIPIIVATGGKVTAKLAGELADGIITFSRDEEVMRAALDSARKRGKDVGKFKRMIEFKCSFDLDYEKALDSVRIWRSSMVQNILSSDISDPRKLEEKGSREVSDKMIEETWKIVTNVEDLVRPIEDLVKTGYTHIQVHSSSPDEDKFVKQFSSRALPHLKKREMTQIQQS